MSKHNKRTPTEALPPISALLFVLKWCLVGVLLSSCSASGNEGGGIIPDKVWDEVRERLEKEIEKATAETTPRPEPIPTLVPEPTPTPQPTPPKPEPIPTATPQPKPPTARRCELLRWNDGRGGMLFLKSHTQPGWKFLTPGLYGKPSKVLFCNDGKCEEPSPPFPKCGGFANPDQTPQGPIERWHACTPRAATEIRVDACPPLKPSAKCLAEGRCD
jgi:hypothetical protein